MKTLCFVPFYSLPVSYEWIPQTIIHDYDFHPHRTFAISSLLPISIQQQSANEKILY